MNWKLPSQLRWRATMLASLKADDFWDFDMRQVADELCEAAAEIELSHKIITGEPVYVPIEEGDRANG
jgi:hypothetical protein